MINSWKETYVLQMSRALSIKTSFSIFLITMAMFIVQILKKLFCEAQQPELIDSHQEN